MLKLRNLLHLADTTFDGAQCDATTRFGAHANLEAGVKIKSYGVFGYMFRVQRQTTIGINVVAGHEVEVGHHVCIEAFVVLPPKFRVDSFSCVFYRPKTALGFEVYKVKRGYRCYLKNDRTCELKTRYTQLTHTSYMQI